MEERTIPNHLTLARTLAHALHAHGAREVFGLPGDFALPLFRAFDEAKVLPVHCLLHEPSVGFAADAAARYGGGIGVALVTYGAGALNMVNAVANAYAERSPVVVVSASPGLGERQRGLRLHHQVKTLDSQRRIFEEITCDGAVLDSVERAPGEIARVLRSAIEHSQPVYLEVPRDLVDLPAAVVERLPPTRWDPEAAVACAREIQALIATARRPAILVDVEVRRYGLEAHVAELARRTGLPIATTFLGSGLFADHPELLYGTYLGAAGDAAVTSLVEDADVLLGLGVIRSDTNLGIAKASLDWRRVIDASERRVQIGYHAYDNVPLTALLDSLLATWAPAQLEAELDRAPAVNNTRTARGTSASSTRRVPPLARAALAPPSARSHDALVTPRDVVAAVDYMRGHPCPRTPMPLMADVGDCLFAAVDLAPGPLIASGYYATMGMAVPAAIGVQASSGERALVLVGDGAFQMTGAELANASRLGCDPIVVVFNNASWAMLETFAGPSSRFALPTVDFAALARAMGGDGFTITHCREIDHALATAAATRGRFQLLDVRLAPGAISERLDRFVGAANATTRSLPR